MYSDIILQTFDALQAAQPSSQTSTKEKHQFLPFTSHGHVMTVMPLSPRPAKRQRQSQSNRRASSPEDEIRDPRD